MSPKTPRSQEYLCLPTPAPLARELDRGRRHHARARKNEHPLENTTEDPSEHSMVTVWARARGSQRLMHSDYVHDPFQRHGLNVELRFHDRASAIYRFARAVW